MPVDVASLSRWSPYYAACRSMPVLHSILMRGFTTVRDAGGAEHGLAQAIAEKLIPGPRLLFSGKALSQSGGHGDMRGAAENAWDPHYNVPSLGRICDGVDAVRLAARDELRRGATQIKLMVGGGISSYTDPITNVQFSKAELCAAVEEAANANRYTMVHAYTTASITHAVECGVRSIEHGNFLDDRTAALMKSRGAFLVPTLVALETLWNEGLQSGMPPELHAKIKDVRDVGPRSLEIAKAHGLRIVYGTDLNITLHRHQSTEFLLRSDILSRLELIRSATCYAAELFQMSGEIGVVAPGARADLIAIDGNPLEDINLLLEQGRHMPLIMKDGILYKNELQN
jgi:imidazolonepropionase-like amidohydrolase